MKGMENSMSYNLLSDIYPCGSREEKRYLSYHKAYYKLAHSHGATKFIKGYYDNLQAYHYVAKHICGEDIGYVTEYEKSQMRYYESYESRQVLIKKEMLDMVKHMSTFRIEKMKELKKEKGI